MLDYIQLKYTKYYIEIILLNVTTQIGDLLANRTYLACLYVHQKNQFV